MNEELEQALQTGTITPAIAEALARLTPGSYCQHKSWGFGKVSEWRLVTGQILIDFDQKPGHSMQAQYAVESLTVIPADDIRARVRDNPEQVKAEAEKDPVGLVRSILKSHGNKARVEQLLAPLVPQVFDAAKAKRWWEATKKKLKADGHFHLPAKKTEPVELLDKPVAMHTTLISKFRGARHLQDQVNALDQLMKSLDDFAHEVEELKALTKQIEEAAGKGRRLQAAQAIELLLARDEILARHEALKPGDHAPTVADILRGEASRLPDLFAQLPATKQRAVLAAMEDAFGADWTARAFSLMLRGGPRLAAEINRLFQKKGLGKLMEQQLAQWIAERSAPSDILYWLAKERGADYPALFNPSLFGAVLAALEMDQLSETKKSMRLRDLLIDDGPLLGEFFEGAAREDVRDAMRRLLLTTVFGDLNKRSLIGRMIKLHPHLQAMVGGDAEQAEESLTVSWASLEKRKSELDDLINRQIPQNVRDISIAREYGDLRENFEFKSAKEQQAVLARRKAELESALGRARGTNFENADTSTVNIGTTVTYTDLATGQRESYSILGAWDSAPELGIVSYKAAIGQALLGRAVGEEIRLSGDRRIRLESIEAFKNLDLLVQIHQLAPGSAAAENAPA
jgi:transcription elongation GreA/GreB family factor